MDIAGWVIRHGKIVDHKALAIEMNTSSASGNGSSSGGGGG